MSPNKTGRDQLGSCQWSTEEGVLEEMNSVPFEDTRSFQHRKTWCFVQRTTRLVEESLFPSVYLSIVKNTRHAAKNEFPFIVRAQLQAAGDTVRSFRLRSGERSENRCRVEILYIPHKHGHIIAFRVSEAAPTWYDYTGELYSAYHWMW